MITEEEVAELPQFISTQNFLQELLDWYADAHPVEAQILEAVIDTACFHLYDEEEGVLV